MKELIRWHVVPDQLIAVCLGFKPSFRQTIRKVAQTVTMQSEVRQKGLYQPYVFLWYGLSRMHKPFPGELVDSVLDEFPNMQPVAFGPDGCSNVDDIVFLQLAATHSYYDYQAMVARLFRRYAETTLPVAGAVPIIRLGRTLLEDRYNEMVIEYLAKDSVPTHLAFGFIKQGGIFSPITWRTATGKRNNRTRSFLIGTGAHCPARV